MGHRPEAGDGRRARLRSIAVSCAVVVAYAGVVGFLTWPLGAALGTTWPRTFVAALTDVPLVAWSLAHQTRAIVGASSWTDGGIYHPTPASLFYGEAGSGALVLFAPVFLATGNPTLAINVVFLGGVVLTAVSLHGVTMRFTGSHACGAIAGATFLATPWVLWEWASAAPNYAVLFPLPVVVLVAALGPTRRSMLALVALVTLQSLASAYLAVATCAPLVVLGAARTLRSASRASGLRIVGALAVTALLLVGPYLPYVLVRRDNPHLAQQSVYAAMHIVPAVVPDALFNPEWPTALTPVAWALVVAGLAALAIRRSAPRAPGLRLGWSAAAFWTAAGFVMALPPVVTVAGRRLVLPQILVMPLYEAIRSQHRLGVATLIGGSILAGVAWGELAALVRGPRARLVRCAGACAIVAAIACRYATASVGVRRLDPTAPYPTALATTAAGAAYDVIARHGGTLLELPVGPSSLGHATAMYRAIFHRQPLVNGYSGYYPATFPERMRLACLLPDPSALAELRRTTGVELVLVHTRQLRGSRVTPVRVPYVCPRDSPFADAGPGVEMQAWLDAAKPGARRDLALLVEADGDLLFEVR